MELVDQSLYLHQMYYLPYDKGLREFSRKLRNSSTLGEILLGASRGQHDELYIQPSKAIVSLYRRFLLQAA